MSKILFISESIRRDNHSPLRLFRDFEVIHLYLNAPYGDMSKENLRGAKQVTLGGLYGAIIKENPDFIQGTEPFGSRLSLRLAYISLKAANHLKAKLIVPILENRPISERFNLVQRAALRAFCPKYFERADRVVALNDGAQRNIKHYCKEAKIVRNLIWGVWGVDLDLFHAKGEKILGRIVYVGRFVEEKGIRFLLEGFAMAVKEDSSLSLDLVGSGELEGEIKSFISENKLQDKIDLVGFVKNEELPKYFSRAELNVYPSVTEKRWEEQVGTVNLQAMACSTPTLTTKSGAIPEYIKDGEGAILTDERSAEAISKAILKFFSDLELRQKLTQGARQAAVKYDIKGEVEKAEKLLNSLTGSDPCKSARVRPSHRNRL